MTDNVAVLLTLGLLAPLVPWRKLWPWTKAIGFWFGFAVFWGGVIVGAFNLSRELHARIGGG